MNQKGSEEAAVTAPAVLRKLRRELIRLFVFMVFSEKYVM